MTDLAPPPVVPQESSSLGGRILNGLVDPGEVWESVRTEAYRTSNWVVPLMIGIAAGILFVWATSGGRRSCLAVWPDWRGGPGQRPRFGSLACIFW